jgi:formylglycine-generating enzyme required for sulfatase activity
MGRYEVTQDQWQKVMNNNPSYFSECGSDCPVENVTWYEALEFANELSRRAGYSKCYQLSGCSGRAGEGMVCATATFAGTDCDGYRLATEAEWEYAARAETTTRWSFGDDETLLEQYAWFDGNSQGQTHPVARLKPNPWHLYDMHGNVWEWCWDWYGPYPAGAQEDPVGPDAGEYRVLRGGSFFFRAGFLRSAVRSGDQPEVRFGGIGFRCVRSSRHQH